MISLSMPPWARGGKKSLLRKEADHKPRKDWERISKNMYVRFDGALIYKEGDDWVAKTPGRGGLLFPAWPEACRGRTLQVAQKSSQKDRRALPAQDLEIMKRG